MDINTYAKVYIDKYQYMMKGSPMSRVQLALNVANLDEAVAFYAALFQTNVAKIKPGYANFSIDDPPLKLVLIENGQSQSSLNHLGVEVASANEVALTGSRLSVQGIDTTNQDSVTCCYAVQDKVWVHAPDGLPWEFYTVLADAPAISTKVADSMCCK